MTRRIIYELDLVVARLAGSAAYVLEPSMTLWRKVLLNKAAYLKGYHDVSQLVMTGRATRI